MILDFVSKTQAFILRVPRSDAALIQELIQVHGLDFSSTASDQRTAVLFTHEPYCAVAFWEHATPSAREQLLHLQREIDASRAQECSTNFAVPADKELWPYQKANLAYALNRTNTLIADEPGLGKTMQAIAFANEVKAKRVLVICPAAVRLQWAKQIQAWSTMGWTGTRKTHMVMNSRQGISDVAPYTIISYDLARVPAILAALSREWYDVLILDEAHYCASTDARRTRAIFGGSKADPVSIASRCTRVIALTGTPATSRPRQTYALCRGLNWDAIDHCSEDAFQARFNPAVKRTTPEGKIFVDERVGRAFELQARLRANIMCRHSKRDVLTQLHLPAYDIIQLEETGPVKQALAAERMLDLDPESLEGADAVIFGQIAAVRKQMGLALAPQIAGYVEMLLDGGEEKLVVFGWHIEVLNILEEKLAKHGVRRIDGSTSQAQREKRKNDFISDPKVHVILGNIQAMGVGVDGLQDVASHVLIAEPDWTPGNNAQAVDRLDRAGQRGKVQADFLVAPNSIAERILATALRKLDVLDKTFDRRI